MDVGEIRYMNGAESLHNLGAAASCERVSWIPLLRYCYGLASAGPLMKESRTAAATERRDLDVNDEGMGRNIDLRARVSGLVARDDNGVIDMCQIPAWVPMLYAFPMPSLQNVALRPCCIFCYAAAPFESASEHKLCDEFE